MKTKKEINQPDIEEMIEKYRVVITWCEEDQTYHASVPALTGCGGHGDTREEALQCTQINMRLWLECHRENGHPFPDPYS